MALIVAGEENVAVRVATEVSEDEDVAEDVSVCEAEFDESSETVLV